MAQKGEYDIYLGRCIENSRQLIEQHKLKLAELRKSHERAVNYGIKEELEGEMFVTKYSIRYAQDLIKELQKILASRRRRFRQEDVLNLIKLTNEKP